MFWLFPSRQQNFLFFGCTIKYFSRTDPIYDFPKPAGNDFDKITIFFVFLTSFVRLTWYIMPKIDNR